MLKTLTTLSRAFSRKAEDALQMQNACLLIDEKIAQAEQALKLSKHQLATLLTNQKTAKAQLQALTQRQADLTDRAKSALAQDHDALAQEAAQALADMANEQNKRQETLAMLETQITRMQSLVEKNHRQIIDLKQGAAQARALKKSQDAARKIGGSLATDTAAQEAQALIDRVLTQEDPRLMQESMAQVEATLSSASLKERLAAAGHGPQTSVSASDILAQLKSN